MSITVNGKDYSVNLPISSKELVLLIEEYEKANKEMILQGHDPETYKEPTWDGFINYLIGNYGCIELEEGKFGLVVPLFTY